MTRQILTALLLATMMPISAPAQVTFERLLNAEEEPQNWLTYSGGYSSNRYTTLDQIGPENVDQLELAWIFLSSNTARCRRCHVFDRASQQCGRFRR